MSVFSPNSFGVIGLGRMAQALLFPLLESGQVPASGVAAAVASASSADRLRQQRPDLSVSTDPSAAWASAVVLLAVKPQQLEAVAAQAPQPTAAEPPC